MFNWFKGKNKSEEVAYTEKQFLERKALKISFIVMLFIIIVSTIGIFNYALNEYRFEDILSNIPEGYVAIPNEMLRKREGIEEYVLEKFQTGKLSTEEKREIIKYLEEQNIDTEDLRYYMEHGTTRPEEELASAENNTDGTGSTNDDSIEDSEDFKKLLEGLGLVEDDTEITSLGDGLGMLNGKPVESFSNLAKAEEAYGVKLGLYQKCKSLENYEMISAYIINKDFMQCVYAKNIDGTPLTDEQDVYESELITLTVKLSTTVKSDELKEVYKDYELKDTIKLDDTDIFICGEDETIHLAYCDRPDNRSYSIYTAQGVDYDTMRNLVFELFNNLYVYENEE